MFIFLPFQQPSWSTAADQMIHVSLRSLNKYWRRLRDWPSLSRKWQVCDSLILCKLIVNFYEAIKTLSHQPLPRLQVLLSHVHPRPRRLLWLTLLEPCCFPLAHMLARHCLGQCKAFLCRTIDALDDMYRARSAGTVSLVDGKLGLLRVGKWTSFVCEWNPLES